MTTAFGSDVSTPGDGKTHTDGLVDQFESLHDYFFRSCISLSHHFKLICLSLLVLVSISKQYGICHFFFLQFTN